MNTDDTVTIYDVAREVERASAIVNFKVVGYVDSENPWIKIKYKNKKKGNCLNLSID